MEAIFPMKTLILPPSYVRVIIFAKSQFRSFHIKNIVPKTLSNTFLFLSNKSQVLRQQDEKNDEKNGNDLTRKFTRTLTSEGKEFLIWQCLAFK